MTKNFKILLVVVTLVLSLAVPSLPLQADETADPYPFVYLFHLYYDNGQLFADRDFEFKYDLIAEPFEQSGTVAATPYKGEVISVSNNLLGSFQFDPTVAKGKISVKGPYFSNAGKVNFYNDKSELLLTLVVSESSVCNENGVCNSDVGEDSNNCSADCKPSPSPTASPSVGSGGLLRNILIGIAGIIAAVVIWIAWRIIKKRRKGTDGLPPTLPSEIPPTIPPIPPTA